MKKGFTLIELIVVIAVLGILAAIIVPNISNVQNKAMNVAIQSNLHSLQTVVDLYQLDHNGELPVTSDPKELQASELDFAKVYPDYLRNLPKTKDAKFWVDITGSVWSSETDMPVLLDNNSTSLSWEKNNSSTGYVVYELKKGGASGNSNNARISYKEVTRINDVHTTTYTGEAGKTYVVGTLDRFGYSSAPIGLTNYAGYVDTLESIKKGESNQQPPVELKKVKTVQTGSMASFALLTNGNVLATGDNSIGQLGLGDTTPKEGWQQISSLSDVKEIFLPKGTGTFFAIMNDGTVKSWGSNGVGLLGFGDRVNRTTPETIPNLSNVKTLQSTGESIYALLNNGTVMSWGKNNYGALGVGDINDRLSPTQIPFLSDVKELFANTGSNVYALLNTGVVKTWGFNPGLGISNALTPQTLPLTDVKTLLVQSGSCYAVLNNGDVVAWGNNRYGQLGVGNTIDPIQTATIIPELKNVKQIIQKSNESIALMNDGTLKRWGESTGVLTPTPFSTLTNVAELFTPLNWKSYYAVLANGSVYAWGENPIGILGVGDMNNRTTPTLIPELTNVSTIVVADNTVMGKLKDGSIKGWGFNVVGQLGVGDKENKMTPVTINLN